MNTLIDNKERAWILIPARKGSKGFPNKNRTLFPYTAETIPLALKNRVYVSTDDENIVEQAENAGFNVVHRPAELGRDETSIRDVLVHFKDECEVPDGDDILMLYLTFPDRTIEKVEEIYEFYLNQGAKSALCKTDLVTHPYLCFHEHDDFKGTPVVSHDLYRRQDYPKCFLVQHYVALTKAHELKNLNRNLYNENTVYYKINETPDIDERAHYDKFLEEHDEKV
jgi:CMP-N-acetylneuraminic acid synthetase